MRTVLRLLAPVRPRIFYRSPELSRSVSHTLESHFFKERYGFCSFESGVPSKARSIVFGISFVEEGASLATTSPLVCPILADWETI